MVGAEDAVGDADEASEGGADDDASAQPGVMCGDSVVAGDEECDDGNAVDGDGCNVDCVVSGSIRWTLEWDGAAADSSTPELVVAGDRAIAYVQLAWDMGNDWSRQSIFHVVDRDGVEEATFADPSSPSIDHLDPVDVVGFQGGDFGVLRLLDAEPPYVVTRYDAGGAVIDAIPVVVEGFPRAIVPQPGRFAIASSNSVAGDAWLTGFDAGGTAQWQTTAREATHVATTPDGAIGLRWRESPPDLAFGLAAYDPLGEPLFEATFESDTALNTIAPAADGWWAMESSAQSRVTHYALDGTVTEVATVDGFGYHITAMPDGDAAVSYRQGDVEFVARLGSDGTMRWQTQMPDDIEVWNLAASPEGFVWVVGQDSFEADVAAKSYLWGIAP